MQCLKEPPQQLMKLWATAMRPGCLYCLVLELELLDSMAHLAVRSMR
jgi:hypothetical protein